MSHRIERREAYHDTMGDSSSNHFHFAKLEGYGNLTIQVGSTAYLHCPVVNLGERPVSHIFVLISRTTHMCTYRSSLCLYYEEEEYFKDKHMYYTLLSMFVQLSWVRRRDWHILSHGQSMFIQDDRFQLAPEDHFMAQQEIPKDQKTPNR